MAGTPVLDPLVVGQHLRRSDECICRGESGHDEVLVFEEHGVAGVNVPSVILDVDLVAAVVIPCIADVETTCCVGSPRLAV